MSSGTVLLAASRRDMRISFSHTISCTAVESDVSKTKSVFVPEMLASI
jgi:hypothetical protein